MILWNYTAKYSKIVRQAQKTYNLRQNKRNPVKNGLKQ